MRALFVLIVLVLGVDLAWAVPQDSEETIREHEVAELGLTLIYAGEKEPVEFLKATPLVAGDWDFSEETKTHFIGSLSYPTENTVDYRRGIAGVPFVVDNVKIRKREDMPVDLTQRQLGVVLRDPDPETALSRRGDGTVYELVGHATDPNDTSAKYGFLFQRNLKLRYEAPEDDE